MTSSEPPKTVPSAPPTNPATDTDDLDFPHRNPMEEENPNALPEMSKELSAVLPLARSASAHDHAALLKMLEDESFLHRLDPPKEQRSHLRLERVLEALAANPASSAHAVLVSLMGNRAFNKREMHTDFLIRASVALRPPSPAVVKFWDEHSKPLDGFTNETAIALIQNGTPEAIALFEKKVRDPALEDGDKGSWFIGDVLLHRNDEPLLLACERLVSAQLSLQVKSALIDSLFDYQPREWFGDIEIWPIPKPPDRAQASPAARATLERIATYVLTNLTPTPRQESAIEAATGLTRKKLASP